MTIVGVTINSPASRGVVIGIGRNSTLDNVSLNAPSGTVQLHGGLVRGFDVEVIAKQIVVGRTNSVIAD